MTDQPTSRQGRPVIPVLATVFNPHHPVAAPEVFHEGSLHMALNRVADTIFIAMREESMERPPTGTLYMEQGAYDLTDIFAAIWNAPESQRLRQEVDGPASIPPTKATEKAARDAANKAWTAFLWDHGVIE
jgi:hypothetical protein